MCLCESDDKDFCPDLKSKLAGRIHLQKCLLEGKPVDDCPRMDEAKKKYRKNLINEEL